MTTEKALKIFKTLSLTAVISFVVMFSTCIAYFGTTKAEYGAEEPYRSYSGEIKYGADVTFTNETPFGGIALLAFLIFIVSSLGAMIFLMLARGDFTKKIVEENESANPKK